MGLGPNFQRPAHSQPGLWRWGEAQSVTEKETDRLTATGRRYAGKVVPVEGGEGGAALEPGSR